MENPGRNKQQTSEKNSDEILQRKEDIKSLTLFRTVFFRRGGSVVKVVTTKLQLNSALKVNDKKT